MPALTSRTLLQGARTLAAADPRLARLLDRHGPPPLWGRPQGFTTLVRIILEQQVSLKSAASLFLRIERELGGAISPESVLDTGVHGLRTLGLTRQKSAYVHALATQVRDRTLPLDRLARHSDDEAHGLLQRVPGIGPWSSSIYLLMALKRPDVWPPGDLALHKAMAKLRRSARVPTSDEASVYARRWRPWRAVAARLLWQDYLADQAA